LSAENGKCVLIEEGLGHVFLSLEDNSVVNYLCSEEFNPSAEHAINPLDKDLAIPFGSKWDKSPFLVSSKDSKAPSLRDAQESSFLPEFKLL
jgi:dTDP-4-dehydrorhamnose 3,5-epimerase